MAAGQAGKVGLSALVLVLPPAITFGLGTWQLQRRQWKIDLLDIRQQRLTQDPIPIENALSESSAHGNGVQENKTPDGTQQESSPLEYRRVTCCGQLAEEKSIYVGPRGRSVHGVTEKGYYLITPLLPRDCGGQPAVLLNRGWVPAAWKETQDSLKKTLRNDQNSSKIESNSVDNDKNKSLSPSKDKKRSWWPWSASEKPAENDQKAGPKIECISGVIRCSETPNSFVPPNRPEKGEWFFIDVPKMAKACGLSPDSPLVDVVKDEFNKGYEKGREFDPFPCPKEVSDLLEQKVMPHDHLLYAATWYTLSAATCFLAYKALRKPPNVRRGKILPSQTEPSATLNN